MTLRQPFLRRIDILSAIISLRFHACFHFADIAASFSPLLRFRHTLNDISCFRRHGAATVFAYSCRQVFSPERRMAGAMPDAGLPPPPSAAAIRLIIALR